MEPIPAWSFLKQEHLFSATTHEDEWEPTNDVRALEQKIRGARREVTFHFYPGTKHWFFEEDRPGDYDREAAGLAWNRTLEFLNNKLL